MEQDRGELHSGLGGNLIDASNSFMFNCPYLGTLEDTDTSLSFPSPANHCFRTKTPASVELSHQENYCLTDMHPGCHIFHQPVSDSQPAIKRKKVYREDKRTRRVSIYALPLILILIFLAAILWWPAPGTTFEEAIAFGAQLGGQSEQSTSSEPVQSQPAGVDQEDALSVDDKELNSPESMTASQEESTALAETGSETLNSDPEPALEDQKPDLAADSDGDLQAETNGPAQSEPAAETSTVENKESIASTDDEALESTGQQPQSSPNEASVAMEETITEESEESILDESAQISQANEANDSEENQDLAQLMAGLPLVDNLQGTQTTAAELPESTTASGIATLIGPDTSTPLAFRNESDNERSLFVRETPTLTGKLLTIINRRQQATILGRDSSGTWLKVRLETGVEGWVNAAASKAGLDPNTLPIATEDAGPDEQAPPLTGESSLPIVRSAIVNTGALNLRSGPGLAYEPVSILSRGEIVGLIGRRSSGVWVKIRLDNGMEGWVNASLLAPFS